MFCGLNGTTAHAGTRQHAAQAGDEGALARIGRGALDHQGAAQGTSSGSSRCVGAGTHRCA